MSEPQRVDLSVISTDDLLAIREDAVVAKSVAAQKLAEILGDLKRYEAELLERCHGGRIPHPVYYVAAEAARVLIKREEVFKELWQFRGVLPQSEIETAVIERQVTEFKTNATALKNLVKAYGENPHIGATIKDIEKRALKYDYDPPKLVVMTHEEHRKAKKQ